MAFGQASGPPAPQRRVDELATLLEARGFDSFKEARHPFGLTQRQASGKFTSAEVDEIIDRVTAAEPDTSEAAPDDAPSASRRRSAPRRQPAASDQRTIARHEEAVTAMSSDVLATELVNRGWCCIPPPPPD